jgi:hypothetical protein
MVSPLLYTLRMIEEVKIETKKLHKSGSRARYENLLSSLIFAETETFVPARGCYRDTEL